MKRVIVLALCCAVSGCGTYLPGLTSDAIVPVGPLVDKIRCEFQMAVQEQVFSLGRKGLRTWQAQVSVTLKSNETGSAGAKTNTIPTPISASLLANVGVGGVTTTTANRTALLKFNVNFSEFKATDVCPETRSTIHPFFTGRIGFAEWMRRAFDGSVTISKDLTSLGHTFEFSIETNVTAGAEFVIGPIAPTTSIGPGISMDRLDDGIVEVSMGPAAVAEVPVKETELTPEDQALIEKVKRRLKAAEEQKKRKVAERKQLQALINVIQGQDKTIQGVSPQNDLPALNSQRPPGNLFTAQDVFNLKAVDRGVDEATAEIAAAKKELAETKRDATKVTTVGRRFVPVPANQNPNIIATQTQLTLERLNSVLRIPAR